MPQKWNWKDPCPQQENVRTKEQKKRKTAPGGSLISGPLLWYFLAKAIISRPKFNLHTHRDWESQRRSTRGRLKILDSRDSTRVGTSWQASASADGAESYSIWESLPGLSELLFQLPDARSPACNHVTNFGLLLSICVKLPSALFCKDTGTLRTNHSLR